VNELRVSIPIERVDRKNTVELAPSGAIRMPVKHLQEFMQNESVILLCEAEELVGLIQVSSKSSSIEGMSTTPTLIPR